MKLVGLGLVPSVLDFIPQHTERYTSRGGRDGGEELRRTVVAPRTHPWHLPLILLDALAETDCRESPIVACRVRIQVNAGDLHHALRIKGDTYK